MRIVPIFREGNFSVQGKKMAEGTPRLQAHDGMEQSADLKRVAARIRPLPANVVPSEHFLRTMRRHILQLNGGFDSPRAA
jgi:hypothetical protein